MTAGVSQRFEFRLTLWFAARFMPLRIYGLELTPLISVYEPGDARRFDGFDMNYILKMIRRTTRRPWFMRDRRCLRQGLLAYQYMKMAGYNPELHFGVDRDTISNPEISAHCWIVLDGEVVLNPPSESMVTIFVYEGPQSLAGIRPSLSADRRAA